MTLGEFRRATAGLPDDTTIIVNRELWELLNISSIYACSESIVLFSYADAEDE